MFLRKAALRPVPKYAVVDEASVDGLEQRLEDQADDLQTVLDTGYREFDRKQPALAFWLAHQISLCEDEISQSLGYFLGVTVFAAFEEAFPTRMLEVEERALHIALETLEADEELRAADPLEVLDSDDVVAMGQPALLAYVQHHLQAALEQSSDEVNLDDMDDIYRAILVEVIALSHSVRAPDGHVDQALA